MSQIQSFEGRFWSFFLKKTISDQSSSSSWEHCILFFNKEITEPVHKCLQGSSQIKLELSFMYNVWSSRTTDYEKVLESCTHIFFYPTRVIYSLNYITNKARQS